jgi:glutaredoxin
LILSLIFSLTGSGCSSCGGSEAEGTAAVAQELPALGLRDDTPELLITWIDAKGDHHVVQHPADVPVEGREAVRVVTVNQGHGDLFYVADLRQKNADGTYPVKTLPRSQWELVAQQRRERTMAALAPSALAGGAATGQTPPTAPPSSRLTAIVYGASWCSACRSAERHLRQQGCTVVVKDIENDPRAKAEMDQKLARAKLPNRGSIPVIDIRGTILLGFDKRDIQRAIRNATTGESL